MRDDEHNYGNTDTTKHHTTYRQQLTRCNRSESLKDLLDVLGGHIPRNGADVDTTVGRGRRFDARASLTKKTRKEIDRSIHRIFVFCNRDCGDDEAMI